MGQAGLAKVGSRGPRVDSAARMSNVRRKVCACTHTPLCVAGGVSNANAWRVIQERPSRDFPSSSVLKTLYFHCRVYGFDLCSEI